MMSLFDDEQIMRTYLKDAANTAAYEADRATAERMIKKGKMSLEDIADCVPTLSFEELKKQPEFKYNTAMFIHSKNSAKEFIKGKMKDFRFES